MYIVQEYCEGQELFETIQSEGYLDEATASMIMKQVLSAVLYCHKHNVVHRYILNERNLTNRDIKPQNILMENIDGAVNVKIIDFGSSNIFDPQKKMAKLTGTVTSF